MFTSRISKRVRVVLATALAVGVLAATAQQASAFTGAKRDGVKYLRGPQCPADFNRARAYQQKVGDLGVVEVYWKASTQENCVVLRKTVNTDKQTVTILALCSDAVMGKSFCMKRSDWQTFPADYGNYYQYAGPIVIKAPGCLYIAAVIGAKKDPTIRSKGLDPKIPVAKFGNVPGSGYWGC